MKNKEKKLSVNSYPEVQFDYYHLYIIIKLFQDKQKYVNIKAICLVGWCIPREVLLTGNIFQVTNEPWRLSSGGHQRHVMLSTGDKMNW